MQDSLEILKKYFGYDSFRPGQERIVSALLEGKDALGIMPTGAGKSVCYQVPALLFSGITLVISPLISLMQDQVKALNNAGVRAAYINSSLTERQIKKALSLAAGGRYRIIYVAPERLESSDFLWFAEQVDIAMVTVDEAHCISQWGQDFRPSYLNIVRFISRLKKRPVVSAFTATATEEVKNDILCVLGLEDPEVVVTGFDRENLYFGVEKPAKKLEFLLNYVREHEKESGIIYCATRKNVEMVYEKLLSEGFGVTKYHAGLSSAERQKNQEDFIYDRCPVVVATNAFGMGIDKSNVRYVLHYNMPQCIENYYQEAGRAGRDGEPAECILLYSGQDVVTARYLLDQKSFDAAMTEEDILSIQNRDELRLRRMADYCATTDCLRSYILNYFGEKTEGGCGNCSSCQMEFEEADRTEEAKKILLCVKEARGRYGSGVIAGTLSG
ncbi:MAG: RecQ family ATP-dependent DNA helicase, partial [Lachnospiraceae bacterium]|nr:RecQ family ATP-dependent DNA helicase [Lachnospiraceae bacterium]